jgi:hypothetical protein
MLSRREFVRHAIGVGATIVMAPRMARAVAPITMTVYKSPTCGCCKAWIKHVEANGFACNVIEREDLTPIKRQLGVPKNMESCHTAVVGRYLIEGHVPADLIKEVLAKHADILGLAVPGMIVGTPGMETGPAQPYKVMAFTKDGSSRVYASR